MSVINHPSISVQVCPTICHHILGIASAKGAIIECPARHSCAHPISKVARIRQITIGNLGDRHHEKGDDVAYSLMDRTIRC